jgi:SHS2 domain-containing protein
MKKIKFLEHTADVQFQAIGKTIEAAFENSAIALKRTMCAGITVKSRKKKIITLRKKDLESLLYSFLEEILYLLDAENFIIGEISKIKIDRFNLKATILGDDASEYSFTNPVKAVTYNDMFIRKERELIGGKDKNKSIEVWKAQVVLDV